jgi:glycosyltransferase involved in cell wall biosynthesis
VTTDGSTDDPSRAVALSVVVPAHDAAATIGEQLDALLAQTWDRAFEVVVVDNRSADRTRAVVEEHARRDARVRLVAAPDASGAAYARNVGILAARADAIAMCDADDVVAEGWVAAMGDALREHDLVAGRIDVHRLNPEWLVASRGLALERGPMTFGDLFEFPHACNMGLRVHVVQRFGGFDPAFPAGEEIELAFRLWQAGIRVHDATDALVHYRYRDTMRGLWRQARAYGRAQPALVAAVEQAGYGVPRDREWRRWLWLVRHVGLLAEHAGRARWIGVAGGRVGRVEGRLDVARRRRRALRRTL